MLNKFLEGLRQIALAPRTKPGEELRSRIRVLCRYPVQIESGEGPPDRAYVVDIGLNGMRVEDVRRLKQGSQVQVASAYPGLEQNRLTCEVVWCRERISGGYNAGLRYQTVAPDSWVRVILDELGLDDERGLQRRKYVRLATSLRAQVRELHSNQLLTEGRVVNVGMGGVLLRSSQPLTEGAEVLCLFGPYSHYPHLSVEATCLSSHHDEDEKDYFHSLGFSHLTAREVREVGRFVVGLLKERSDAPNS
ncbi:PilZ domain-containing protein [bacterium CPR1]|nr:PilZ domain-containing protein [bacterium CPR1]